MCEHSVTFDHFDFWEPLVSPPMCTRQCLDCFHTWKVFGLQWEQPVPEPRQVLADITGWRMARQARERAAVAAW